MTLRVATLNIWNRMGVWEDRLAAIREQLPVVAPAIMGLQEVIQLPQHDVDQARDIAKGFGYHVAFGRAEGAPHYALGNAILSKWPIERSLVFALPGTDENRCLVFAEVTSPFGKIPFFSTHLNWKLHEGHIRQMQVRAIASHIASLAPIGTDFPPIIVGDFNAEPESDEIRFMKGFTNLGAGPCVYFADCFGIVGEGPSVTFAQSNPNAATLREPNRRIDYIFSRGPDEKLRGAPIAARVCFNEPHVGAYPSDHYGVYADISTE